MGSSSITTIVMKGRAWCEGGGMGAWEEGERADCCHAAAGPFMQQPRQRSAHRTIPSRQARTGPVKNGAIHALAGRTCSGTARAPEPVPMSTVVSPYTISLRYKVRASGEEMSRMVGRVVDGRRNGRHSHLPRSSPLDVDLVGHFDMAVDVYTLPCVLKAHHCYHMRKPACEG
jgi:hypothetical protein